MSHFDRKYVYRIHKNYFITLHIAMKKLIAIASLALMGASSISSTFAAAPQSISSVDLIEW